MGRPGEADGVPIGGTRVLALLGAIGAIALAAPASASAASADIAALQVAMGALGLYPHSVDGISGPWTQGAVRTFQSQHGLTVDGIAGPRPARRWAGGESRISAPARCTTASGAGTSRRSSSCSTSGASSRAASTAASGRTPRARYAGISRPRTCRSTGWRGRRRSTRCATVPWSPRGRRAARSASSARCRAKSATASAGSRPGAGTPASTSQSRWGHRSMREGSAWSPSRASTPAATAISW